MAHASTCYTGLFRFVDLEWFGKHFGINNSFYFYFDHGIPWFGEKRLEKRIELKRKEKGWLVARKHWLALSSITQYPATPPTILRPMNEYFATTIPTKLVLDETMLVQPSFTYFPILSHIVCKFSTNYRQ